MSIELLKAELASLPGDKRRQIMAWLVSLGDGQNAGYRQELARRIDDQEPGHWMTLEEMDRRLGPLDDAGE